MDTNENHAAGPAEPHFYALEQLADLAHSIRMTAQTLPGCREQMGALLNEGKKAEAFGLYQSLEYQRGLLAGFLRDTRPLLMELEHPLVQAVEPLVQELVSSPVIKCKKTPRKKCSFVAEEAKKR